MDLSSILEVAIGIIFVWIVLSLTTIQIQEWITTRLNKRAKDMEASIHEMLANPDLNAQFYDHPVIRGMTLKKRRTPSSIPPWFFRYPILRGFTKEKRKLPSYIPSQQFALALFDIAMTANTESSIIQQGILRVRDDLRDSRSLTVQQAVIEELNLLSDLARSAAATEAGTAITNKTKELLKNELGQFFEKFEKNHPDIKMDSAVAKKIKDAFDDALKQAPTLKGIMQSIVDQQPPIDPTAPALSKVRRGVAALSVISPEVHQTLSTLLMNVEEYATDQEKHLAKARQNVERWFDDAMDRVSGVFKRYTQMMAFIIGFIVALVLNVDSVNLTEYLWRDPTVRQTIVAQASRAAEQPQTSTGTDQNPKLSVESAQQQLEALHLPVGWGIRDYEPASCQLFPSADQVFGVPIPFSNHCLNTPLADDRSNVMTKLLGVFLTALAAMQGAPFWFDMLKRLVNLRGTGPNPVEKGR